MYVPKVENNSELLYARKNHGRFNIHFYFLRSLLYSRTMVLEYSFTLDVHGPSTTAVNTSTFIVFTTTELSFLLTALNATNRLDLMQVFFSPQEAARVRLR